MRLLNWAPGLVLLAAWAAEVPFSAQIPGDLPPDLRLDVKDRHGRIVLTFERMSLFRHSEYFHENITVFQSSLTAHETLFDVQIRGELQKKDGSTVKFDLLDACPDGTDPHHRPPCNFSSEKTYSAVYPFAPPWPFRPGEITSINFVLERALRPTVIDGFRYSGFLAKDTGCLKDYLSTLESEGVERRKKLAELLEYDCGLLIKGDPAVMVEDTTHVKIGTKQVPASLIVITSEGDTIPEHLLESGWVATAGLTAAKVRKREDIGVGKAK